MIIKRIFRLLVLMVVPVIAIGAMPGEEVTLDILFTSSINGNLDGCECIAVPRAGMVSSAVYLRTRDKTSTILVDLGDFMDVYPDDLLVGNILQVFDELEYDLLATGDQEFTEGIDYLKNVAGEFPVINNNMAIDGALLADSAVLIERMGRKIGFASIIDSRVFFFHPADVKGRLEIEDVEGASTRLSDELDERGADLKVLLFHGRSDMAEELYNRNRDWDILLYGHDQQLLEQEDGSRYLASPGDNGNRVGIASVTFRGGEVSSIDGEMVHFDYMTDARDPAVKRRIDLYKKEMIERLSGD